MNIDVEAFDKITIEIHIVLDLLYRGHYYACKNIPDYGHVYLHNDGKFHPFCGPDGYFITAQSLCETLKKFFEMENGYDSKEIDDTSLLTLFDHIQMGISHIKDLGNDY